jgi:hypothetical protein
MFGGWHIGFGMPFMQGSSWWPLPLVVVNGVGLPQVGLLTFMREFISGFWGKLWSLIVSHGFFVWSWSNKHIWHNLSHPSTHLTSPLVAMVGGTMCWCKKGWCVLTKHGICQNHHLAHMHFHIVQCTYLCCIFLNYGANKKNSCYISFPCIVPWTRFLPCTLRTIYHVCIIALW